MERILVLCAFVICFGIPKAYSFTIPQMFEDVAEEYRIPSVVFYAMIYHESKRATKEGGVQGYKPWPWTINHKGKGYYFDNKGDAVDFAEARLSEGSISFDIGYGQVNWKYHGSRFDSLEAAFDPRTNLEASAAILAEQYYERKGCDSWLKAVGCYHRPSQLSKDRKIAREYAKKVALSWRKIKDAQIEARIETVVNDEPARPANLKVAGWKQVIQPY